MATLGTITYGTAGLTLTIKDSDVEGGFASFTLGGAGLGGQEFTFEAAQTEVQKTFRMIGAVLQLKAAQSL